jgi:hypothetical protein
LFFGDNIVETVISFSVHAGTVKKLHSFEFFYLFTGLTINDWGVDSIKSLLIAVQELLGIGTDFDGNRT